MQIQNQKSQAQNAAGPANAAAARGTEILRARSISRSFRMGESSVAVLKHVDLTLHAGEFVAIEGRSGSGKSTLLHILGALDSVDNGSIEFDGKDLAQVSA